MILEGVGNFLEEGLCCEYSIVSDYVVILITFKWAMITLFSGISKSPLALVRAVETHKKSSLYNDC